MGTSAKRVFALFAFLWAFFGALFVPVAGWAIITPLPPDLARDALSETVPTAVPPFGLDTGDYVFEWEGAAIEGVELRLLPGSLQWARVMDALAIPRARLEIVAQGASAGRATSAGFHQPLVDGGDGAVRAELPVALISGDRNPVEIVVVKDGKETTRRVHLKFRPGPERSRELGDERVFSDPSCSRFGVEAKGTAQAASARGWAYVGCRFVELEGKPDMASALELFVFWDGVGQEISVGGVATSASPASLWPLRLRAEPGAITLNAPPSQGGDSMALSYRMPKIYHRGALGLGLGPYSFRFEGAGEYFDTVAPVVTLYGSYFLTEAARLVTFGAITVEPHLTTDVGIYISTEYLRILDRRLVANILLGVHGVGFRAQGEYQLIAGLPQGTEVMYIDAFKKGYNFTVGFFLQPRIDGKSYNNIWVRWGGRVFAEINYISWAERLEGVQFESRSLGVCVGFPLARFF